MIYHRIYQADPSPPNSDGSLKKQRLKNSCFEINISAGPPPVFDGVGRSIIIKVWACLFDRDRGSHVLCNGMIVLNGRRELVKCWIYVLYLLSPPSLYLQPPPLQQNFHISEGDRSPGLCVQAKALIYWNDFINPLLRSQCMCVCISLYI